MRHMKLRLNSENKRLGSRKIWQESGHTLHELLIASSILSITISGFSSGIISSNQITHQASLRKSAESVIANDLEANVKRRFYTFRCRQGPCGSTIEDNDKSLMYYDKDDSDDKDKFMKSCKNRVLAKELLDENKDLGKKGEKKKVSTDGISEKHGISISRVISFGDNENQATILYEAEQDKKIIATIKTTLVPNAVHWCN